MCKRRKCMVGQRAGKPCTCSMHMSKMSQIGSQTKKFFLQCIFTSYNFKKKTSKSKEKTHILHFVPEKRRFLLKYHFPILVLFDADSKKVGLDFCKVVKLRKFRISHPFGRWWEFCDRHDKSVSATLHSSLRPIFWYKICFYSPYIQYMHF